jgi:hypothetical protein
VIVLLSDHPLPRSGRGKGEGPAWCRGEISRSEQSVENFGANVDVGRLMSYRAGQADGYRRVATYVDRILKDVKRADLPVEQPTKFEFVINLKTAKQIDVTIPPDLLARATKIIR